MLESLVDLGDKNDILTYAGAALRARLDGQDGDDQLTATSGTSLDFFGGPGNDTLNGGPGNDALIGGPGNDVLIGNGGSVGETDNAQAENITGGNGSDTLIGDAGSNELCGFSGADTADYSQRTGPVAVTLAGNADDGEHLLVPETTTSLPPKTSRVAPQTTSSSATPRPTSSPATPATTRSAATPARTSCSAASASISSTAAATRPSPRTSATSAAPAQTAASSRTARNLTLRGCLGSHAFRWK